ncbi:glycosyltransferase family protein [Clostridium sp. UBA1056]|uniref:glycosyltransferase family protein n=1 Tax=unclassified Clostridium TaxID=2614128 RepID=UPI003217562D
MKITAIIQARMGSTRLPGKVMKNIFGKTVLEHVVDRLRKSQLLNDIIIATTIGECDNKIAEEAERLSVNCYRGSENDVLSRYYNAAKENGSEIVIRITSDCPVIDPRIIDSMLERFIELYKNNEIDYMSNTLERTFPRGLDAEIIPFEILEKAYNEADKQYEREHVTPYIYQNPETFKLIGFKNPINYSEYRWTLDTPEDFEVITRIYKELYKYDEMFYFDDIMNLMKRYPEIKNINDDIEQKKLGE